MGNVPRGTKAWKHDLEPGPKWNPKVKPIFSGAENRKFSTEVRIYPGFLPIRENHRKGLLSQEFGTQSSGISEEAFHSLAQLSTCQLATLESPFPFNLDCHGKDSRRSSTKKVAWARPPPPLTFPPAWLSRASRSSWSIAIPRPMPPPASDFSATTTATPVYDVLMGDCPAEQVILPTGDRNALAFARIEEPDWRQYRAGQRRRSRRPAATRSGAGQGQFRPDHSGLPAGARPAHSQCPCRRGYSDCAHAGRVLCPGGDLRADLDSRARARRLQSMS